MLNNNYSQDIDNNKNKVTKFNFNIPVTNTATSDINKYNHLSYYQKQQQILSKPNSTAMISSAIYFNNLASNSQLPYINTINNNYNKISGINSLENNNLSNKKLPIQTEQDILDISFLNSLKDENDFPKTVSSKSTSLNKIETSNINKNQEQNLIDFDASFDLDNFSAIDLFDPLKQEKIDDKMRILLPKKQVEHVAEVSIKKKEIQMNQQNTLSDKKISKNQTITSISNLTNKRRNSFSDKSLNVNEITKSRIESFEFLELNETQSIFENFIKKINEIKNESEIEQTEINDMILFSPILDFPPSITRNLNIKINIRYYNNSDPSKRFQPADLLVSLNATVETIVYNTLNLFNITDLNTSKYLLKIHGLEEYLPYDSILGDLKYIHDCLNENKEPVLILTELKNANTDLSKKKNKENKSDFNYKFTCSNLVSKSKIEAILKSIIQNRNLLESSINNSNLNLDSITNWLINLVEKLKSLKSTLSEISHDSIEEFLNRLDAFEKKIINYRNSSLLKEKEPLLKTMELDYDYKIDLNTSNTTFESFLKENLEYINKSIHEISNFINCASNNFFWPYKCNNLYDKHMKNRQSLDLNNLEINEIIQADQKLTIYFKGLSRLSYFFNKNLGSLNPLSDLYLKFSIYYGTKCLDSISFKLSKFEKIMQKKIDFFIKTIKIEFSKLDLCVLPRESNLFIEICATNPNINTNFSNHSSMTYSFNNFGNLNKAKDSSLIITSSNFLNFEDKNDKCLAWTSKALFDENLFLDNNEAFLCFFETEYTTPVFGASASNIYHNKSPVIQVAFPKFDCVYRYPNKTNECDCKIKDFQKLSDDIRDRLLKICNKNINSNELNQEDKDLINEYYIYLSSIPNSLPKVYYSLLSYDYSSIIHFYAYLKYSEPLRLAESIELLQAQYPDIELRKLSVKSLELQSIETISIYLPQLLEALKYEKFNQSELANMILRFSLKNVRFSHQLFWQLNEFKQRKNDPFILRYDMMYNALEYFFNTHMKNEIQNELFLVNKIDFIASKIKETKDIAKLLDDLDQLQKEWSIKIKNRNGTCRLPFNISYSIKEIDLKSCSYINSFTMPLKLVFKNSDSTANSFYTIYKIGDDLRQDMLVLQLITIMNQLWLAEDLDLNLITFQCLQTGDRCGFIEMITNAETLKEIQKGAVLNAFKKSCINDWLRFHNPKLNNFKKAVENFTKSCAAYSVATYILGIGDRHNDNLMIKYTGHMFHIDFGKYLGDVQTFAGFKRDRSPIIFTSDMFYVINQSKEPNHRFQEFMEVCCRAFQILRKNYHHILSLFELMINSGIPGLNHNAIQYVYKNLMINLNEDDSSNAFKKMIHESLSKFASFNFAIHTLAQPKTVISNNYFSFVTHVYNSETDGKILKISLEVNQTSRFCTTEMFKCLVMRETEYETNEAYRSFDEFCELYQLLIKTFPTFRFNETPSFNKFKDTKQFLKRYQLVDIFLKELSSLQAEISQSDIVYTFFHPIMRDKNQESFYFNNNPENVSIATKNLLTDKFLDDVSIEASDIKGQLKLKLKFNENKFYVNCLQCRNLRPPNNQSVSSLKPYVKCYLRPDWNKATKKKVQALYNGANPIFTETMEYDISLSELKNRTLELSILNNKINAKEKIGSIEIRLYDINWNNEYIKWYDLR